MEVSGTLNQASLGSSANDEVGIFDCEWGNCGFVFANKAFFVKHVAEAHVKVSKFSKVLSKLPVSIHFHVFVHYLKSYRFRHQECIAVSGKSVADKSHFFQSMICRFTSGGIPENVPIFVM